MTPAKDCMPGDSAPLSSTPPTPARSRRVGPITLPARTVLVGVYIGRLFVAVLSVLTAALGWTSQPEAAFLLVVAVLFALLLTTYGAWRTVVRQQPASVAVILSQGIIDLMLVSALGNYVGADHPVVVALLVLIIALYALMLP
ncbi:MAG TPA: hypothetical protein VMK53_04885, partial [Gemmatimonadales bacterium]|nr:hypothetical protein [Gemmatimonadales bacterium]